MDMKRTLIANLPLIGVAVVVAVLNGAGIVELADLKAIADYLLQASADASAADAGGQ